MKTSNYSRSARIPGAISISSGVPHFYQGPRYIPLAPDRSWLHLPIARYDELFRARLAAIDPKTALDEMTAIVNDGVVEGPNLIEPVMLCWESPNVRCHRRMVAEWFQEKLGIQVPEIGLTPEETMPYHLQPLKGGPAPKWPPETDEQRENRFKAFQEKQDAEERERVAKKEAEEARLFGKQESLL